MLENYCYQTPLDTRTKNALEQFIDTNISKPLFLHQRKLQAQMVHLQEQYNMQLILLHAGKYTKTRNFEKQVQLCVISNYSAKLSWFAPLANYGIKSTFSRNKPLYFVSMTCSDVKSTISPSFHHVTTRKFQVESNGTIH